MGELVARLNVARRILAMQEELHAHSRALREMHDALERQNALLVEMADTDPLTGLKNRRHFFEVMGLALSSARCDGRPMSLVMLDVDHFKSYNDEYGHPAGDEVLRMVADVVRSGVRRHDLVARYGGEEFVILLPSTAAEPAARSSRGCASPSPPGTGRGGPSPRASAWPRRRRAWPPARR